MGRLLVTGFEPFDGETVNPSQKIIEALGTDPLWRDRIVTRLLPVSFTRAFPALKEALTSGQDLSGVLMFGQAGGRAKISLERVALNWVETLKPDEDGILPALGRLRSDAPEAFVSRLPLADWKKRLEDAGVPCEVSLTAGGFVCNSLSFQVAEALRGTKLSSLFVHVPYLPEQAQEGRHTMEFSLMKKAAMMIIEAMEKPPSNRIG